MLVMNLIVHLPISGLSSFVKVSVARFGGANVVTSSTQRGGVIRLTAPDSFEGTISRSRARMSGLISSKLDQCFELSEYDWTPNTRETSPSMYLYELVNWLTTVVDSLVIKETYKDEAYKGALGYIVECLMVSRWWKATFVHLFIFCPGLSNWAWHTYDERKCHLKYPDWRWLSWGRAETNRKIPPRNSLHWASPG